MKKGISLVILVITIIILIILTGVIIIRSSSAIVNTEKHKLQIDIAQLEALMNTYKIRKNGNIPFDVVELYTAYISSEELLQFEGENIVDNKIKLYVIELAEIDAEQVNYGNLKLGVKDRYLYSIDTGKVYYEQGLQVDNTTYYYVESGEI